ncbi:putative phosphatidylethanolamine-binding protein [Phaeomoniella chlamydospora]|uniref:Putative phosphatidylethanolamine-binding protein n=1 Tax=Phaeomoniella chlamydospora TaxID=158046 RepID=A0A0G2FST2_PHACM|nr:putative phosphatidylethanolamine-binding protein [Phaeomoniella chlamydospora]
MSLSVSYPDSHEDVILGNEIPVSNVSDAPVFEFHPFVGPHNGPSFHRRQRLKSPRAGRSSPLFQAPVLNPSEDLIYTLALTDPDAKSRYNPIWSEMAHWIVTNLTLIPNIASPSDHFSFNDISPSTLLPYLPPSPPPKTGPHRYVFVLLAGTPEATAKLIPPKKSKEGRQHWGYDEERTGVKKWAEDNGGLEIVGVNFFFARSEEQ